MSEDQAHLTAGDVVAATKRKSIFFCKTIDGNTGPQNQNTLIMVKLGQPLENIKMILL